MAATESPADRLDDSESSGPLTARQLAVARGRAYGLLSRLYLAGVTEQDLAQVRAIPELAGQLCLPLDADEAAADHHHLFSFNVHPYQSYFLDPAGLLGGPVAESVSQTYERLGFSPGTTSESVDHIGLEVGLLASMCAAEAEALKDGLPDMANRMASRQLSFMVKHLLPWIGPFSLAVGQQGQGFYSSLAQVTYDLVQEHATELSGRLERPLAGEVGLPSRPDVLVDEGSGLKEIAGFLLTPAYSGIYLSRDDIGRLARRQAIPRGFGDRRQLLLTLLRSAANYDALEDVIDNLVTLTRRWLLDYDEMITQGGIGPFASGWRERTAGTIALLKGMRGRIEALN